MLNTIKSLPNAPGVYHYYDKDGRLLYIGKAKNLSKRVKSYFRFTPKLNINTSQSTRICKMLSEAVSLSYVVLESEHDALILENSLIKQLKPHYNILLRDDKTYPYIYIDHSQKFARFEITRRVVSGEDIEYFGPYSVGARDILNSIYELIPLVQKKSCIKLGKACLYYQMNRCLAPCENRVSEIEYRGLIVEAKELINNKTRLLKRLKAMMSKYAQELRFEEATAIRDRIDRISKSEKLSGIDLASKVDYDIFAIALQGKKASLVKMFMRNGKVVSSTIDNLRIDEETEIDELYERSILEFYTKESPPIKAPILVAHKFAQMEWVESGVSKLVGKKITITSPQRGVKLKLTKLAYLNAQELLKSDMSVDQDKHLAQLQQLCLLRRVPERIEIFDNSHLSSSACVGAMVVYERGRFQKNMYRNYKLDSKDEYAQMREVLTRRIDSFSKNSPPDLWILDGGTTLLNLALSLIDSSGVNLDVIAISKEKIDAKANRSKGGAKDLLHTKDQTIKLKDSDKRLQFVQLLRDEAHRVAVTFHRKIRQQELSKSKLLQTKGISEAKVERLLNYFGTFEAIYKADEATLKTVLNSKDAKNIKRL